MKDSDDINDICERNIDNKVRQPRNGKLARVVGAIEPTRKRQDVKNAENYVVYALNYTVGLPRIALGDVMGNFVKVRERLLAKDDAHAVFTPCRANNARTAAGSA